MLATTSRVSLYREAFFRLFFPATCGVCRSLLAIDQETLCGSCGEALERAAFPLDDALCPDAPKGLGEAWSLYRYESPVREILAAVKFSRERWLLKVFKPGIARLMPLVRENRYWAVVPVPLERKRLMMREFNQAEVLAGFAAGAAGLPVSRLLEKTHGTPPQSRLSRDERRLNLCGTFRLRRGADVAGKSFLLIDDILTTGATAEEAAQVLLGHGAARVDLFTAARTEVKAEHSLLEMRA